MALAAPAAPALAGGAAADAPASVALRLGSDAAGPRIEPALYGHFVEHLGTGVYGGLWVGPDSPIPNTRGWRKDALAALRQIGVPVVRWPGGCFADDYDWRDGIGPPAQRPVRLNKLWGGVLESNAVGTHEFMDFLELLGADAYLAGNMGSLPPRAMSQWLEYLTSDSRSSLAEERRRNGRDKPWAVKYFGVGNETWGCGGHMRPQYAADLYRQYSSFLHAPVQRVAVGDGEGRDEVNDIMMSVAGERMDALSIHHYSIVGSWADKGPATGFSTLQWAQALHGSVVGLEERIRRAEAVMDRHDPKRRVALFVDEWGLWHAATPGSNGAFLQQGNTLRDALAAALAFHVFHRHTARVKMANIAQLANVLQALLLTDGPQLVRTPTYHAFDLYQGFKGALPLALSLDSPRWREGDVELPLVDASAARAADGTLHLALVNLHPQRAARVHTGLRGAASGRILSAPALDAQNRFGQPEAVRPQPYALPADRQPLVLDLPPHALLVLRITPTP